MPLTPLQSPKREYTQCQSTCGGIEHDLAHAPILMSLDSNQPFELVTDACDEGIGAVLLQDKRPVAFNSSKSMLHE